MSSDIVRIPVEPATRPRRTIDERIILRAPILLRVLYRALARRGNRSRLRRAVLVQSQLAGWEAQNRQDWDINLIAFHEGYEFTFEGPELKMGPDIGTRHVGRSEMVEMMGQWREVFEVLRFEPLEVLDPGGSRFGVRVRQRGRSRAGLEVSQELWSVYWLRDGLIERQSVFYEEAAALAALRSGAP